jgi:hypothetical protein
METLNKQKFVFQTDSNIVCDTYNTQANYLIEYNEQCRSKDYCAVYFCSNDIYYPNTEEIFKKRIIEKNFFEWYNSRIEKAYKHIFIRDVFKQWYLSGINSTINSPEKLVDFLKKEIKGYHTIMLGSSAGAYAAILYGSILKAEKIIAFNPQFELKSLLERSSESINPLIFRLRNSSSKKYYDIVPFIGSDMNIYYYFSNRSKWDIEQQSHVGNIKGIHQLPFKSAHHGIPFLKVALPAALNLEDEWLKTYENKVQHPLLFTIKLVGIKKAIMGFITQAHMAYQKRH